MNKIGSKVICVSHADKVYAYIFGHGIYEGPKQPKDFPIDQQPAGMKGRYIVEAGKDNPCIKLEDGNYVWGCECWWDIESKVEEYLTGLAIKKLDIKEIRNKWMKEIN